MHLIGRITPHYRDRTNAGRSKLGDEFVQQWRAGNGHQGIKETVVAGQGFMTIQFPFENSYARLPDRFFARVSPTPVAAPKLVKLNRVLALQLGLGFALTMVSIRLTISKLCRSYA